MGISMVPLMAPLQDFSKQDAMDMGNAFLFGQCGPDPHSVHISDSLLPIYSKKPLALWPKPPLVGPLFKWLIFPMRLHIRRMQFTHRGVQRFFKPALYPVTAGHFIQPLTFVLWAHVTNQVALFPTIKGTQSMPFYSPTVDILFQFKVNGGG